MNKIWTVDAFAKDYFTGNPAGVMIVEDFPSNDLCQKIAAEINLSETSFIKSLPDGSFQLRWFTPSIEVDLCGHATLAAAHILFEEKRASREILFRTRSGDVRVISSKDGLTLDFPLQHTGQKIDVAVLLNRLDIRVSGLCAVEAMDDVILELASADDLKHLKLDPTKVAHIPCRGLIVTAKSEGVYDFVSRFFAPNVGVNEDPVTGSAHCKLAHYWQQQLNKNTFFAYQASTRGGEIHITIKDDRVHLTGRAITVMEGFWRAPV